MGFFAFLSHLSIIRGNDFIAHWAYAQQIFANAQCAMKFLQFLYGHLNACWAYTETISSHAEHTRNQYNATNCLDGMGDGRQGKQRLKIGEREQETRNSDVRISSHTEHSRKQFHRMLSIRGKLNISAESNTIIKNLLLQALGTKRFWFIQKSQTKFHVCVPLKVMFVKEKILSYKWYRVSG